MERDTFLGRYSCSRSSKIFKTSHGHRVAKCDDEWWWMHLRLSRSRTLLSSWKQRGAKICFWHMHLSCRASDCTTGFSPLYIDTNIYLTTILTRSLSHSDLASSAIFVLHLFYIFALCQQILLLDWFLILEAVTKKCLMPVLVPCFRYPKDLTCKKYDAWFLPRPPRIVHTWASKHDMMLQYTEYTFWCSLMF